MTRVTYQHLRTIPTARGGNGYCSRGARPWALQHGIDWGHFVRHGIEAERLEAIGDAFALALVKWARACEARTEAEADRG